MRALVLVLLALAGCADGHFVRVTLDAIPDGATEIVAWIGLGNEVAPALTYPIAKAAGSQSLVISLPKRSVWASGTFAARDDNGCDLAVGAGGVGNRFSSASIDVELALSPASGADCGIDHTPGMVRIAGGTYVVGCDAQDPDCYTDESPTSTLDVPTFELDATEVSIGAYRDCIDAGACTAAQPYDLVPSQQDAAARYGLTWDQAAAFCTWMNKALPSEVEWEAAMRGAEGRKYPWGAMAPDCSHASYSLDEMGTTCRDFQSSFYLEQQYPAGASPNGLWDGAGNVAEWVNDWYAPRSSLNTPALLSQGPATGSQRVTKGGGWASLADQLRGASRVAWDPQGVYEGNDVTPFLGVRCGSK